MKNKSIKELLIVLTAILFVISCHSSSIQSSNDELAYTFKIPSELCLEKRTYTAYDYSSMTALKGSVNFELDKIIGYVIHQSDLEACFLEYYQFDYIFSIDNSVINPLLNNRIPIYSIVGSADFEMIALVPSWYISYYKLV